MFRWLTRSRETARGAVGRRGEEAAARHLSRAGYRVLARNLRLPSGEIDILAAHDDCVVIVEVKSASTLGEPNPAVRVGAQKRRKLVRLAAELRARRDFRDIPVRFDIVTVQWDDETPVIHVYPRAFDASGRLV